MSNICAPPTTIFAMHYFPEGVPERVPEGVPEGAHIWSASDIEVRAERWSCWALLPSHT